MKSKKLLLLSGAIVVLFSISFLVYSQINAQNSNTITQAEFVNTLIRVLGLDDQLPPAATLMNKVALLESLGYAPLGRWSLESILTKGDAAVVIVQILGITVPAGTGADGYVQALADLGIMTPGGSGSPLSPQDLENSINAAASYSVSKGTNVIQPYRLPASPTR